MRGCTLIFNNKSLHTGESLGLVQEVKTITKPTPKTYTVEVPGRNGLVDLSTALTGYMVYSNRTITLEYLGTGPRYHLLDLDDMFSAYHGQYIKIIDDDYPDYYYQGRATVSSAIGSTYIKITLKIDAYPFKTKLTETVLNKHIDGYEVVYIDNDNPGTNIPFKITIDAGFTINDGTTEISLSDAGTYEISSMLLKAGRNKFIFSGTGNITLKYTEEAI